MGPGESSKAKLGFCRANEFGKCFHRAVSAQKALQGLPASCLALQFEEIFCDIELMEHPAPSYLENLLLLDPNPDRSISRRAPPQPHLQDVWCLGQSLFIGVSVRLS